MQRLRADTGRELRGPNPLSFDSHTKTVTIARPEHSLLLHVPTTKKGDGKKQN